MIRDKVSNHESAPYVYLYPTPRMFKPIEQISFLNPKFTEDLNVYIHIPFCRQKCTWCGYLTVIEKKSEYDLQDEYVNCIVKEICMNRDILGKGIIRTINFGGGTPSLLTVSQFAKIMLALLSVNPKALRASEISIEATPESIESGKIAAFKELGLNRVSVGVESFVDAEISVSHRHNSSIQSKQALRTLRKIKISNVCVDLMYGLPGQTFLSWIESVGNLLRLRPHTIELYALSEVKDTSFAETQASMVMTKEERLACYYFAREVFLNAGYKHDCHMRFVLPNSDGYLQQKNVFKGQSLIGFGVGARSYAQNLHYRNAYHPVKHRDALNRYMKSVQDGFLPITRVSEISPEEQIRQYVIYNLEHLNKGEFLQKFGVKFEDKFAEQYKEMIALGLAEDNGFAINSTLKGYAFRDVVAQSFFSKEAKFREGVYRANLIAA